MPDTTTTSWVQQSGWADLAVIGRTGSAEDAAGVVLTPLEPSPIASVIVRPDRKPSLAKLVHDAFACALPEAGRAVVGSDVEILGAAPGQWLIVAGRGSLREFCGLLGEAASAADQSDSRLLVGISGAKAQDCLAKLLSIDLHASSFPEGSVGSTRMSHVGVQIWLVDGDPAYRLALPRSFAGSLWSELKHAAAEFGCATARGHPLRSSSGITGGKQRPRSP